MVHKFASLDKMRYLLDHVEEELATSQKPVIGWFCAYTPVEILMAGGFHTYRIVPEASQAITLADSHIERNFCPYVRSCLGEALNGRYGFLNGLVVLNSCDAMRRMYDAWHYYVGGDFISLLDLPRINSVMALTYYRECLLKFIKELVAHYQVDISDASIAQAIATQNKTRSLLREFYRLNQERGMPVSGVQTQMVIKVSTMLHADVFAELVDQLLREVANKSTDVYKGPRVLITGSIMDNPLIIELIEQSGAKVAGDDLCTGSRLFWELVKPDGDPIMALSRYHLNRTPCPRMQDAQKRFDHVFQLVDDLRIDGVIFYTLKFCDPSLYDVPVLKSQLAARGIPSLVLEGDYTPGTLGRVKTRIQAFVEMLVETCSDY